MTPQYLILDLDNTLYPKKVGLIEHIDQRIDDFLMRRLAMERTAVNKLRSEYYRRYGTTLRGIRENHGIDPLEYFDHAYHVDLRKFLSPDPRLRSVLQSIPAVKVVFSNSPLDYVERVLEALGIRDLMDRVFDLTFTEYRGKPDPEAYRMVLDALGAQGNACMMVEDYAVNLAPAKALLMTTVLIDDDHHDGLEYVDYRIESIYELATLWRQQ